MPDSSMHVVRPRWQNTLLISRKAIALVTRAMMNVLYTCHLVHIVLRQHDTSVSLRYHYSTAVWSRYDAIVYALTF